jgi:hypothetical protein
MSMLTLMFVSINKNIEQEEPFHSCLSIYQQEDESQNKL